MHRLARCTFEEQTETVARQRGGDEARGGGDEARADRSARLIDSIHFDQRALILLVVPVELAFIHTQRTNPSEIAASASPLRGFFSVWQMWRARSSCARAECRIRVHPVASPLCLRVHPVDVARARVPACPARPKALASTLEQNVCDAAKGKRRLSSVCLENERLIDEARGRARLPDVLVSPTVTP